VRELYRTLEVEPSADFDTIRESYRRLLKRYHPDSGGKHADRAKLDSVIEAFCRVKAVHPRQRRTAAGAATRGGTANPAASAHRTGAGTANPGGSVNRGSTANPGGGTDATAGAGRAQDLFSLGRMLTSGPSTSARTFAARSLGNLGKRSGYAFLKQGLRDREEQVVISCLRSIGRLRIAQSAGDLSAVFQRGTSEMRRVVMETVGEINRLHLFRNLILAGLEDADSSVRQRALKLFMKLER
jgi:hypothetical protein